MPTGDTPAKHCHGCGKPAPVSVGGPSWLSYATDGWVRVSLTCRHEEQYTCPECLKRDNVFPQCSICGCNEEYT